MATKTVKQEDLDFWSERFNQEAVKMADELLDVIRHDVDTYGEASSYLKQVSQRSIYDITDPENRAARSILDAVCHLAQRKLADEKNELPIKRSEDDA